MIALLLVRFRATDSYLFFDDKHIDFLISNALKDVEPNWYARGIGAGMHVLMSVR